MKRYCYKCKKQTDFDKCGCDSCVGHCFECDNNYKDPKIETENLQCLIDEVNDETSEAAQHELNVLINKINFSDKTSICIAKSCKHCKNGEYQPDKRYQPELCYHLRANPKCNICSGGGFIERQNTLESEKPETYYEPCNCALNAYYSEQEKIKKIRAIFFDCDGVLFSGRVFVHPSDGEFLKERSLVDGQGITNLRKQGFLIGFITGEISSFTEHVVSKFNHINDLKPVLLRTGVKGQEKVNVVQDIIDSHKIKWNEVAYMGDDLSDLEILEKVGYPSCPENAEDIIKTKCKFISKRKGGDGAIRDLANHILKDLIINKI